MACNSWHIAHHVWYMVYGKYLGLQDFSDSLALGLVYVLHRYLDPWAVRYGQFCTCMLEKAFRRGHSGTPMLAPMSIRAQGL